MKIKLLYCNNKLYCQKFKLKKLNNEKRIKHKYIKKYFKLLTPINKSKNVMEI